MTISKTFLDIQNEVCLNIFQAPVAGLNANTVQHVKNTINTQYKDICGMHKDWLFLNRVMSVPAWKADTDAVKNLTTGTHAPTVKYNIPSISSGNTLYVAQNKANANAYPIQINTVTAYLGFIGINQVNSTAYIVVCPDKDGSPDIDNPYGTSAAVSLTTTPGSSALVSSGVNKVFTLTNVAVPKSVTYWIVLKIKCNAGASTLTVSTVTETGTTGKVYNPVSASTWSATTGIYFYLTTYDAEYSDVLTVGPGVQEIIGFYDEVERQDRLEDLSQVSSSPLANPVNDNTYEIKRVNADGTWTVHFKNDTLPLSWLMEYKATATDLSADTSEPYVPEEYRTLITIAAILSLRAEGRGINSPDVLKMLEGQYGLKVRGLRSNYLPEMSIQVDRDKEGFTPGGFAYGPGFGDKRRGRRYL